MITLFIVLLIDYVYSQNCRLESSLVGTFKKQTRPIIVPNLNTKFAKPLLYETVTIGETSISDFGECYEKIRDSYIFGEKRMGRPLCYRCVTPIIRTPNVIQLAHQAGEYCHDSMVSARKTCFEQSAVRPVEGTLLFRSTNLDYSSCDLDGRFSVIYHLRNTNLTCEGENESKAENCEVASRLDIKFKGCSFPDFDMSLRCLGSWKGQSGERFLIIENADNEEYRCGLVHPSADHITVHFSNDSSCEHLNRHNAFETYRFKPTSLSKPLSPCEFPAWLHGQYTHLDVSAEQLQYNQGTSDSIPIVSYCVATHGERILVYSESKCGDALGYHCLWFRMRSDSVLEFRTTNPQETLNSTLCQNEKLFERTPWTSVSVKRPTTVSCGLEGVYRTPADMANDDCYSLEVDCNKRESLQLKAYHCASGIVFDTRLYACLASWHDGPFMYLYAKRIGEEIHACFVAQKHSGRLFIASSGAHCSRDFTFETNVNTTLILQQETNCTVKPGSIPRQPAHGDPSRRPMSKTSPAHIDFHPNLAAGIPIYTENVNPGFMGPLTPQFTPPTEEPNPLAEPTTEITPLEDLGVGGFLTSSAAPHLILSVICALLAICLI
ncbi:unnamed protein product, partial [Mesorhabditis belari]|uniref:Uncharacterized protein n=1 Tax=Mesorhabditis belari TaxID=2138241 RepID=A0AAF3F4H1_9BILA